MDRFTYEQLRVKRPELDLPYWHRLRRTDRHRLKRMTLEQLIAGRVWRIISSGGVDALQPSVGLKAIAGHDKWLKAHDPTALLDTLQPVKPSNLQIAWIYSRSTLCEPPNFFEWLRFGAGKLQ